MNLSRETIPVFDQFSWHRDSLRGVTGCRPRYRNFQEVRMLATAGRSVSARPGG